MPGDRRVDRQICNTCGLMFAEHRYAVCFRHGVDMRCHRSWLLEGARIWRPDGTEIRPKVSRTVKVTTTWPWEREAQHSES